MTHKKRSTKRLNADEELEVAEMMKMRNTGGNKAFSLDKININFKCKTENQKKFVNMIKSKVICIGAGLAGCGKTFVACAQALKILKDNGCRRIILVKSVTDLKGEELGFIKGSIEDKMSPYMESFKDNFRKLIGDEMADYMQANNMIQVQPLAYIRGRTFDNSVMIIDEAQNLSFDAMHSILTRIGDGSKIILIGDTKQIDLTNKKTSSFQWLIDKFEKNELFGVTKFGREDQVRHPIINVIEDMFDERETTK